MIATAATAPFEAAAFERGAPADAGFPADLAARLEAGFGSGLLRPLHGVLLMRDGRILLERYAPGPDQAWGRPLGEVSFGPQTLHDLRSVTKSVTALLYGIALARGQVPAPETALYAAFPEFPDLVADPARAGITVRHALTMTLGLRWDESLPYTDPRNSEIAMEQAPDRLRFVLEQPVVAPPGARWTYGGNATTLLAALITRGTGLSLPDFAREALFAPLGITRFEWHGRGPGDESAASGLRMTLRDLAKIGELLRTGGSWDGRPVVPGDWLAASAAPAIGAEDGLRYGLHWYLGAHRAGGAAHPWIGAFGNGGQRLWSLPAAGLTLAIFSGDYDQPEAWVTPVRIWREIVLANLRLG
ncbi:MAG: beta-lactamase family protein [Roseomonas sp.]|nr:beta-lactamase family protein [Roseomonas sp.]